MCRRFCRAKKICDTAQVCRAKHSCKNRTNLQNKRQCTCTAFNVSVKRNTKLANLPHPVMLIFYLAKLNTKQLFAK